MEEYLKEFKRKKSEPKQSNKLKLLISRILLAIIFFLVSIIYTNYSDKNLLLYKEYVLTESMPFVKIKSWYEDIFGEVLPHDNTHMVGTSDELLISHIENYYDGEALSTNNNLLNAFSSGVVVFLGEKENYGNTIIIQGIDGYDIWYGNIDNISVKLYDYIEKDTLLGEIKDRKLYLVIKKNNEYIKYEEYNN